MLTQITGKEIQRLTHVYCRVYLKYFLHSQMQRANLLDRLQNLQVVAALRSAMLISLQVFGERRFRYRVGFAVSLSVYNEIIFNWSNF